MLEGVVTYGMCKAEDGGVSFVKGGQGQVHKVFAKKIRDGIVTKSFFAVKRPVNLKHTKGLAREAQVYFNIDPSDAPHLAFLQVT